MSAAGLDVRCVGSYKRSGFVLNALREYLSGFQGLVQDYLLTWRLGEAAPQLNRPGRATPSGCLCRFLRPQHLEIFVDPCEQISLHLARHRLHGGSQMKHFHPSALADVPLEYGPQRRLGVMCFECCDLGFKSVADINHSRRRRESKRLPAGQCEIRS